MAGDFSKMVDHPNPLTNLPPLQIPEPTPEPVRRRVRDGFEQVLDPMFTGATYDEQGNYQVKPVRSENRRRVLPNNVFNVFARDRDRSDDHDL
jgi:hypothetical protein